MMDSIELQLTKILGRKSKKICREINGQKIANHLRVTTQKKVRRGTQPSRNKPFAPLRTQTIKRRKNLEKHNRTDRNYSPAVSNATFSGELVDSYVAFHEKRSHGFSVGYIISDAKHSGYNTGSSTIANRRSYSQIRARLRRLQMDPAGIKQSKDSPLYRNIKEFIKREMRKHLS